MILFYFSLFALPFLTIFLSILYMHKNRCLRSAKIIFQNIVQLCTLSLPDSDIIVHTALMTLSGMQAKKEAIP